MRRTPSVMMLAVLTAWLAVGCTAEAPQPSSSPPASPSVATASEQASEGAHRTEITPTDSGTADAEMTELQGKVVTPSGSPIVGATVSALRCTQGCGPDVQRIERLVDFEASATTDISGVFTISVSSGNTYALNIEIPDVLTLFAPGVGFLRVATLYDSTSPGGPIDAGTITLDPDADTSRGDIVGGTPSPTMDAEDEAALRNRLDHMVAMGILTAEEAIQWAADEGMEYEPPAPSSYPSLLNPDPPGTNTPDGSWAADLSYPAQNTA